MSTPTYDQVAKAKAAAEKLEAAFQAAEQARYKIEKDARIAEVTTRSVVVDELESARDAAETALGELAGDPTATLEDLFGRFAAVKVASAAYLYALRRLNAELDSELGVRKSHEGADISRSIPLQDPWGETTFDMALERHLRQIQTARAAEHDRAVEERRAKSLADVEAGDVRG